MLSKLYSGERNLWAPQCPAPALPEDPDSSQNRDMEQALSCCLDDILSGSTLVTPVATAGRQFELDTVDTKHKPRDAYQNIP